MPAFVYSPHYAFDWTGHVFPVGKYRQLRDRILELGLARPEEIVAPEPVTEEQLLLVHERSYLARLELMLDNPDSGYGEAEAPYNRLVQEAFRYGTGGSILASRLALEQGVAMNLSGGFHHAYPDHGEGFCFINDIAVAIRVLQKELRIQRAAVVDCDLHQGNGTAFIFRTDPTVWTFSIHEEDNYPRPKETSDLDIGLPSGAGDDEYEDALATALPGLLDEARPDLIIYQAGADPYKDDQLGRLQLTLDGLRRRDELVFRLAQERRTPIAVLLGGGYPRNQEDVVNIHLQTVRVMRHYAR